MGNPVKTISRILNSAAKHVWKFLFEPFTSLSSTDRRLAILSAVFLLLTTAAVLIEQTVGGRTTSTITITLFVGYLLARTQWFKAAMFILMAALSLPSYMAIGAIPDPTPGTIYGAMIWLVLPLILSSLFYSVHTTICFALTNIILIALLPYFYIHVTIRDVSGLLGFYGLAGVFMIAVMTQRNQLEQDRQRELLESRNQLADEAVQRKRFAEQSQRRADQLVILNEIGQAVSDPLQLETVLDIAFEQIRRVIPLEVFFVALYDEAANEVAFPIMYDNGRKWKEKPTQLANAKRVAQVIQSGAPLLSNRSLKELEEARKSEKRLGDLSRTAASVIICPLQIRGRVIGAISVQQYEFNAYTDEHLTLLSAISQQIVVSIENARLYTAAQDEIRERQRVEMELQKERDYAVQVMNTLGQGVSVSTLDGRYEYVNPAYSQLLGYLPEEMIGKSSDDFIPADEQIKLSEQRGYRKSGKANVYETRLMHRDGHTVHVLVTGVPRYASGTIIGSIAAITDLTERKKAELERETLLTEMETKNAELERFTYTVSHDLKSPLVTIAGFMGILEKDVQAGKYDQIPHTIERIREAAKRMQRLLDELLELSRVGRIANPSRHLPFGVLVKEALELVDGQLKTHQVNIRVDEKFPVVHVDQVRMIEVLQNLIVNAINFMGDQENPSIEIGMQTREQVNVFFVRDNGMGIPLEYHEQIFGLFNKLDANTAGTGIGLALVRRIIEYHGGRIWVESEGAEKGSTFCFTLPA